MQEEVQRTQEKLTKRIAYLRQLSTLASEVEEALSPASATQNEASGTADSSADQGSTWETVKSQLEELEKRTRSGGRVAIIGLEKAGKSTFLNALMGEDLLPYAKGRCTLATTTIRAAPKGSVPSLTIRYRTNAEFAAFQAELGGGAKNSDEDLNHIAQHGKALRALLDKPDKVEKESNVKELRKKVRAAVAHPATAYAVASVTLSVPIPEVDDGTEICDAPGVDSGMQLHEDALDSLIRDCDAVIYVKNGDEPSLKKAEQELVVRTKNAAGAAGLLAGRRSFVMLTKLDVKAVTEVTVAIHESKAAWKAYGVSDSRVFVVSPRAELLRRIDAKDWEDAIPQMNLPDTQFARKSIQDWDNLRESLSQPDFPDLLKKVRDFIRQGRFASIEERVDELEDDVVRRATKLEVEFAAKFNVPRSSDASLDYYHESRFQEWVDRYIKRTIGVEVGEVFGTLTAIVTALDKQPDDYRSRVESAFNELNTVTDLNRIFMKHRVNVPEPDKADMEAREALHNEVEA